MLSMILAANLYIFGDSLSSPTGCEWGQHIQDYAVHNYAQAGLTLEALDVPGHLKLRDGAKVVIHIGSNDAGAGTDLKRYKGKLKSLVLDMQSRGADVIIVGQPDLDEFIPRLNKYRKLSKQVAKGTGSTWVPMTWDTTVTVDGLHPTCEQQVLIADQIQGAL